MSTITFSEHISVPRRYRLNTFGRHVKVDEYFAGSPWSSTSSETFRMLLKA